MDPLSKDANDALKSLLDVEPTRADEARVRADLEKTLGIALPIAVATSTAAVSAVGVKGLFASLSVGMKVTLVTVAVVSASAVTTLAVRASRPEPSVPVTNVLPRASPPAVVAEPPPMVLPELELVPEEVPAEVMPELVLLAPPEPPRRPKPAAAPISKAIAPVVEPEEPAAPPPTEEVDDGLEAVPSDSTDAELARDYPNCDLTTETRLSAHVRWMTRNGNAERGLALLTAFQHRCATGHWTYDSWVARFASLCALERRQEFNELWAWFRAENDYLVDRVRRDLDGQCAF